VAEVAGLLTTTKQAPTERCLLSLRETLMACSEPAPATVELRLTAEHDPAPFWLGRTDPGAALGMGTHGTQRICGSIGNLAGVEGNS